MSTKIRLVFQVFPPDPQDPLSVPVVRLMGRAFFKTWDGYTHPFMAIIDTGSPTSVIPFRIWARCAVERLGEDKILGFVDKEECAISVTAGYITCVLYDEEHNQSGELRIRADLAATSEVPFIIGFKDVLERGRLVCDYQRHEAFLEIYDHGDI